MPIPTPRLTRRQVEIWRLIALGGVNKGIAFDLRISESTVGKHREALMGTVGARCIADLTRLAVQYGLIEAPVLMAPGVLLSRLPECHGRKRGRPRQVLAVA